MNCIAIAETTGAILELIAAAQAQDPDSITAITFDDDAAQAAASCGVDKVIKAVVPAGALKEGVADIAVDLARENAEITVFAASSKRMVNMSARIAQALGTCPIVDVKTLEGAMASHMLYGGSAIANDEALGGYRVYVMSPGAFAPAEPSGAVGAIEEREIALTPGATVKGLEQKQATSVDLEAAKRVVCIGRGVSTREGYALCQDMAGALGAEMGCSRPVTETAEPLMPRETYIGTSGRIVKPELYVGIAVSGQSQHTMGMYESKCVVVVNKSKEALFFSECDYGIVGDYETVVPAITAALNA